MYIYFLFIICFHIFNIYKLHSKKRELRELRELLRKMWTKIWRFAGGCLVVTVSFLFYDLLHEIQMCLVWHFKGCIQTLKNGYEVIAVNGEKSAKALPLPRDSSFFVLDSTAPFAYLVETDKSGYKTVTRYRRDCNRGVD